MAKKKYVPAGVFLTCDKGTLPGNLNVTFNARTTINGMNLATDLDRVPGANVPPLGVCAITKAPCVLVPLPGAGWSPVKTDVKLGMGRPLLEDSQLRCGLGGCISIHFSMAAAQAACAPPPAPEKSVFDQADDYLKTLGSPLGDYGRFQLGVAEGVWAGGKGLAEGLWGLAKGGWNAVTHPADTAKAIQDGAASAYKWAGDSQNWSNAASSAGQGISNAAAWAGNGENWQKVGDKMAAMSPRDWGNVTGQVAFEVGLTVGTAGAGTALNAAAKTSRVARMALRAAKVADIEGHAMSLAARGLRSAAGKMKVLGKVMTGAKKAKRAEKAVMAGRKAKKLKAVAGRAKNKRTCLKDPIDVATGVMLFDQVDLELPGPIPFVWERTWYSNSEYNGPLGYGWHHGYDLALTVEEEGVAVRLADGRLALFEPLTAANTYRAFNRTERLELQADEGTYRMFDVAQGLYYCFTAPEPVLSAATPEAEAYILARMEDANGFAIRFAYDTQGRLHTIRDSAGREIRLVLNAQGRLESLEAPLPDGKGHFTVVRYQYDSAGNMTAATDTLGHAAQYMYQDHLMVRKTLRTGLSFYFEYQGSGSEAKCVRTWGDGNMLNGQFLYEPGQTTVTSSLPGDSSVYYHEAGLVTTHVDALGAVRQWQYSSEGDLLLERDPLGQATSYDYDERGHLIGVGYPDGGKMQTQYEYDLPVTATDAGGQPWAWTYDKKGNLLTETNPLGEQIEYTYTNGLLSGIDKQTSLHYDTHLNLRQVITADGRTRQLEYDRLGRLTKLINAEGRVELRQYDLLGQLTAVQEANGEWNSIAYDPDGNIIRAENSQQQVELEYQAGQVVRRRQAGIETAFQYDLEGRLIGLLNADSGSYRFILDAVGRVVEEHDFDGRVRQYTYDVAGRVQALRRPSGRTTHYTHDGQNRVTEVRYQDGSQEQYEYTPDGKLREARNAHAQLQFEYDALGRLTTELQNEHAVVSSYDVLGYRSAIHSSLDAEVLFDRDAYGRVARVRAGAWQSAISRDANGRETERLLTGGISASWLRDTLGRPVRQLVSSPAASLRKRVYRWQGADTLTEIEDSLTGSAAFAHDPLGALVAARYADGSQELRQPDAVGNLFRTPARQDRVYDKTGQLREANGTRYRYDDDGNLIRKITAAGQAWFYQWDDAGQLISVTCPNGYAVTFSYDALGRRISKRYRGRVTRWVWDGAQPLHEWTELELGPGATSVQDLTTWLFEDDSFAPLAKLTRQGAFSVITDHLGTPFALYNAEGVSTWQAELDSYGAVRAGKGKPQECPFRYQGQYEDVETGLYYNRFRYYDPEAGQYISPDPLGLAGGPALYAYVTDPLTQVDVLGLSEGSGTLGARMVKAGRTHGISPFPKSDFRAHHVIPHDVWTDNQDFFDDIGLGRQGPSKRFPRGFNPKDAVANGVFMPKDAATGAKYKFDAYHSGGHPNTIIDMRANVETLRDRFDTGAITKAQARKEISALQKAERRRLSRRSGRACTIMP